jgi:hypothetical protein
MQTCIFSGIWGLLSGIRYSNNCVSGLLVLSIRLVTRLIYSFSRYSHVWLKKDFNVEAKMHCVVQELDQVHVYE